MASIVVVVGLGITLWSSWVAWTLDQRNEHSLLEVQSKQAAAVLTGAIAGVTAPLSTALRVEQASGGSPDRFAIVMAPSVGADRLFVHASLWDTSVQPAREVANLGVPSEMTAGGQQLGEFLGLARQSDTFVVTNPGDRVDRVAYAVADRNDPRYVVYAERAIPPSKVVPVQRGSAFASLDFATYIGTELDETTLATTNVPESQLPLSGDVVRQQIPFGDTTLTLLTRADGHLGGELGLRLPWMFLLGGALLTAVTAVAVTSLVRSRRRAEDDGLTISELYDRLDAAYAEQRGIAETLQRSLLPASNPVIDELEIASRYVAGAQGVDVGGDWYSVIRLEGDRVGFVVGDVSGRGIGAAVVMARLRFTIRAYLVEGHSPSTTLEMCSRQFDIDEDGHFTTVLVGIADLATRSVELANAGHFAPLMVCSDRTEYLPTLPGPPIGIGAQAYTSSTTTMPPGSTLVAFTDGLIERRDEDLTVGLDRLASAVLAERDGLENVLDHVLVELTGGGIEDDTAVLALRWRGAARADVVEQHAAGSVAALD
ncbi:MAG TPA: PP2C family protein-serine/threonine phosphatase [Candidatus Nanopelagicales bacterium]|nr:PP2C family protein-serine/threonine phosphatase [Candidatus Nanopelagicales bacterium]